MTASDNELDRPIPAADRALRDAFIRATVDSLGDPSRAQREGAPAALTELRELVACGAGTSAFHDHELRDTSNFASVVDDWWVRGYSPNSTHDDLCEALLLCIEAGPAFLTNRAYVGNGGLTAIWFLFEGFRRPQPKREPFALRLLNAMCETAEPESPFWGEFLDAFVWNFMDSWDGTPIPPLNEAQRFVATRALSLVLEPSAEAVMLAHWHRWERFPERVERLFQGLIRLGDPELIDFVLELATAKRGVFAQLPEQLPFAVLDPLLKFMLRDKARRRQLQALLRRSEWVRDQVLSCPELVFSLARRRERKLLEVLLDLEPERMRALRDPELRTLLHVACEARGRTERIVILLLGYGFNSAQGDARGRDALELAKAIGNVRVAAVVAAALHGHRRFREPRSRGR